MKATQSASDALPHGSTEERAIPPGLVNMRTCMAAVWPDPDSRPSERWFKEIVSKRIVPVVRLGGLNFFEVPRVLAVLRSKFEVSAR